MKDKDYVVFVVSDNKKNDKIFIYNITSKQEVFMMSEIGMNYKIKSLSADDNFVYILSGETIYRYPYSIEENKASIETDKKEELGSKGSLYTGVLALKSVAFTTYNVFFSVSDASSKNYSVLSFDNDYNPIGYLKLDSTPLISSQRNNLFVAMLNNISQYKPDNLKYLTSKTLKDMNIKLYTFSGKHYFVVEEQKDNSKNYCIYSLEKLDENPLKINCLDENIKSIYVESGVIYALAEKTGDKWRIYSINDKKEICSGTTGYPRTLIYDSNNKVFLIGVSANPSKILATSDCKKFIEYKFDKSYDTIYLTKKDNDIYLLVSSKYTDGYKSVLYKLTIDKKE
jgi:hypothetical protein